MHHYEESIMKKATTKAPQQVHFAFIKTNEGIFVAPNFLYDRIFELSFRRISSSNKPIYV